MAKSRAQRKAERRAREQQGKAGAGSAKDASQAQHDTQVPRSGDVEEVEAVEAGIGAGAAEEDLELPDAPAPAKKSRAEKREEKKRQKESEKRQIEERKRQEAGQLKRRKEASAPRQRSGVLGFLLSSWAELKKVQWPDRDTLIQASAVTLIFVAIAAAYLGTLDWIFSELMRVVL